MYVRYFIYFMLFTNMLFSVEYTQNDEYIATLKPYNSKSGLYDDKHVIQGIASYNDSWIVVQSIKNKQLLINILDENGTSYADSLITFPSHGADLSIRMSNNKKNLYLYTQGKHRNGIVQLSSSIEAFRLKVKKSIPLTLSSAIPSISENKAYFAVKSRDSIYIYRYVDIAKNTNPLKIFSFILARKQREKGQWFQGIAMKDGLIYCLTGDNTLKGKKYLYIYDSYGRVNKSYTLTTGIGFSKSIGKKWELEGLAFKENILYTTVMAKDKKHYMRLYKILSLSK